MNITYKTSDGFPVGYVANVEGYLCFIEPGINILSGLIVWRWVIQSGGGWTDRGGEEVKQHFEGIALSSTNAEVDMIEALEQLLY